MRLCLPPPRSPLSTRCADLAEKVGADVQDIGWRGHRAFDNPASATKVYACRYAGPVFGGSCFPEGHPARWFKNTHSDHDCAALRIVCMAVIRRLVNEQRASARWPARSPSPPAGSLRGKTVAAARACTLQVPTSDDMREAPSIPLVDGLLYIGAKVRAMIRPSGWSHGWSRRGKESARHSEYCADDPYACAKGADAMVGG